MIKLWDLRSSTSCPVTELSGHSKGVLDLYWNTDDVDFIISTGRDNRILLWDFEEKKLIRDLTGCEETKEVPKSAADFFTTVGHAASSPRRTQILWNPFNPAILASTSTNGSIELWTIEEMSVEGAMNASASASYSAINGVENRFHGRVLTVSDLIRGKDIQSEISDFETAMVSNNVKEHCMKMVDLVEDEEEKQMWSFMNVC